MASAAVLNLARINGPLAEHSLGNLLNARSKATKRLENPKLSMTHNANRNMINMINRHIELRKTRSRNINNAARTRRMRALEGKKIIEESESVNLSSETPYGGPHGEPSLEYGHTGPFLSRSSRRIRNVDPEVRPNLMVKRNQKTRVTAARRRNAAAAAAAATAAATTRRATPGSRGSRLLPPGWLASSGAAPNAALARGR